MRQITTFIIVFFAILLYGCGDCMQIASATVLDATTKQPIDNVKVYKNKMPDQNTFTNDKGQFELNSISGGLFGCPPMTVVLTKAGYQSKTVEVRSDSSAIVYLTSEKAR